MLLDMRRVLIICLVPAALGVGCGAGQDPLEAALPALPPEGGPAVAAAGRLSQANFEQERVPGPAALGLPGDYFMRNDKIRVVVQAPGRAIGPCPYGGDILDADRDPALPCHPQPGRVEDHVIRASASLVE